MFLLITLLNTVQKLLSNNEHTKCPTNIYVLIPLCKKWKQKYIQVTYSRPGIEAFKMSPQYFTIREC